MTLLEEGAPAPRVGLMRNSGWNLLGQGLPLLVALAALPVVVRGLGPDRFGVLALAWTIVGTMNLFDFGFGRAAIRRIAELHWSGEDGRIAAVAATVARAQLALGLLTGTALFLGAPAIARVVVPDDPVAAREASQVMALLAAGVPAMLMSNAYRAALEGLQRFDLVNAARAPLSAAMFLIPALGVLLGWSLPLIVAVLAASRFAGVLAYYTLFRRAGPAGDARFNAAEFRGLFRFGAWVAVSSAIIPLVVYLERLAVAGVEGSDALAFYAAPHELVMRLLLIPAAVAAALFPAFSGLSARDDDAGLLHAVNLGTRVVAVVMAPVMALLVLTAEPLLRIWLGADYAVRSSTVLQVLAVAAFFNALAFVPLSLVEGRGKPEVVAKYHLIELPVYAAVLWYLVNAHGILGAAIAWACRMLWTAPLFYALALSRAGVGLAASLRAGTLRAILAGIALLIAAGALARVAAPSIAGLGARATLLATFVGIAWPLLLNHEDRVAARALRARVLRS